VNKLLTFIGRLGKLDQNTERRRNIIAISAVVLLLSAIFVWPVPGFLLAVMVAALAMDRQKGCLSAAVYVPVCTFLFAVLFAFTVSCAQSLAGFDMKNNTFIERQALPVVVRSWFSSGHLGNPANDAGRIGIILGSLAGLALARARYRPRGAEHNSRRVHGLLVASNAAKGTRRWADDSDLAHVADFGPPKERRQGGGTIAGKLQGRMVRLQPEKCVPPLPQHAVVIAGTGAGKSYSFVIPNAVAAVCEGESLVVTDPKGELTCMLAPWLRSKGYKVFVFDLLKPEWGNCWNPVMECRDDEEITAFATAIVQNASSDRSGYFVSKEIQLLKALVYLLRSDFPPEQAHLRSALSLLSWPEDVLKERFEKAYLQKRLPLEGYEEWCGAISKNYDSAVSGLSAKLNVVRSSSVANLLSRQEIDLAAIGKEKSALFCVIPVQSAHLKPVLATFYYFFFRRLYGLAAENGGKLPTATRFLLDEFANVGVIPSFVEVISTARSLGIKIQIVLQGLKQLQDNYGSAEAEAIMANCPIQLFLGGDDNTSTRYFSTRLGEAAVYAESERRNVTLPWNRMEVPKRTETIIRRPLMDPQELSGMDPLAAVALVRWSLPIYLKKTDWMKDIPQAKEILGMAVSSLGDVARPKGTEMQMPPLPIKNSQEQEERPGGQDAAEQREIIENLFAGDAVDQKR
jgi:type IV secretion system protein VirD4